MEIFMGKRTGNKQKTEPEQTRADLRTCYSFQHHCPTAAALHNKLLMEQQQEWEDAAVEQLGTHQLLGERARSG